MSAARGLTRAEALAVLRRPRDFPTVRAELLAHLYALTTDALLRSDLQGAASAAWTHVNVRSGLGWPTAAVN
jgi:hypothetical protein